ncbi:MAG: TIGR04002 family protein [Clostridia bacterium]|nr:TIGR04002 family protein [Clostridia bacterium]
MNKKQSIQSLVLAAILTAVIALVTGFLQIPIGVSGYIHPGDAFIYLTAALLPTPFAVAAAAIGAGLADFFAGAPIWIPFTVVIKACMALCLTAKKDTIVHMRNIVGALIAGVINAVGYYLAEAILYGNWLAPLMGAPMSAVQSAAGLALFAVLGLALDRYGLKNKLRS